MADGLKTEINKVFWICFRASFEEEHFATMKKILENENGEEIYWLYYKGIGYFVVVFKGKPIKALRGKC